MNLTTERLWIPFIICFTPFIYTQTKPERKKKQKSINFLWTEKKKSIKLTKQIIKHHEYILKTEIRNLGHVKCEIKGPLLKL